MADLIQALKSLQEERACVAPELAALDRAIAALGEVSSSTTRKTHVAGSRHIMSASGRKRIAAAQKARWAKWRAKQRKQAA